MDNFAFWQKWLVVIGWILVAFGLALALFSQTPVFDFLFNNQINAVFWPDRPVTPDIFAFQAWIYGVLGATIAGWGLLFALVASHAFRDKERWAWTALAAGITLWFVVDTAISIYYHAIYNAAFNVVIFILVILPLLFTRRAFA